ncbi:putative superfamily III holin-X [Pseudonocardia hierapolitana]|uniref:Putative superfamily III holin-X n=1 Tax=Pseudonocardia hierapolitana TaxID=1128676 RepID=A0A561SJ29_9PSEU|nr:phage holin family protein [Pseudonocardia hierapolitana]TWF74888.1 putative superfamily III holin-X [Pseudonocardia hierapolitana]
MTAPPYPPAGGYPAEPQRPGGTGGAHARPTETAGRHEDVGEVSLGQLVGDVTRDLSTLMRQELALARAELKQEASKSAKGAGALGGAGFAGSMAVLFLSIALWWALSHVVGHSWSALIVAVIWGIVAAVLAAVGRRKFREVNPTPERTVDTLKTIPDALKGERGGTP